MKHDAFATSRALFWAVVSTTAGVFIGMSVLRLALGRSAEHAMSDTGVLAVIAVEMAMAAWWVPRLARHGWTLRGVTLPLAPRDFPVGVGIVAVSLLAYWMFFIAVALVVPDFARAASAAPVGGRVSWWAVAIMSIVNPIAEEFIYLGFVVNALRREGLPMAFSASVVIRVLVHLYQGPIGVISNIPLGSVLALSYLATGRLWPAVIAHGILDVIGLWSLVQ